MIMKKTKKLLSIVLALTVAFSILTLAGVSAGAYEQDSGKHYILPTGDSITTAAKFALGETVYGAVTGSSRNCYKFVNNALRDITFTALTDKRISFTVLSESANPFTVNAQQRTAYTVEIPANSSDTVVLTNVPSGTYFIQIDGTGTDSETAEFYFASHCAGLPVLVCAINNKMLSMVSGDTETLRLSALNVNDLNCYWESVDDPMTTDIDESKLVSVDGNGVVRVAFPSTELRFVKQLTCVVRAVFYYSPDGNLTEPLTKSCTVTLTPPNIYFDPYVTSLTLKANETKTIKATTNVKNATIDWKSSDPSIADVNELGVIRAYEKEGLATITAAIKYNGEVLRIRREIKVFTNGPLIPDPSKGLFDTKAVSISVDESQELSCTITYSDGTTAKPDGNIITFTSSNPSVATVTDKGVVKGIDEGEAIITATVTDASGTIQDTCTVTVTDPLSPLPKPIRKFIRLIIRVFRALFQIIGGLTGSLTGK